MNSQKISRPEGTVRVTEKIRAIRKLRIPVITPVAAVNSSGESRFCVCLEIIKYAVQVNYAAHANKSPVTSHSVVPEEPATTPKVAAKAMTPIKISRRDTFSLKTL